MLIGSLKYRKVYQYRVEGVDTSETLSLWLTSYNYNAMLLLDNEGLEDSGNILLERRCDITLTKVKVETYVYRDSNGKKKKTPVNLDFFCRLGAVLRWVKSNCSTYNEEGYTGLQLASGEFEASIEKQYIIKFPMDESKILAKVTLVYGEISSISVHTDDFDIELHDEVVKENRLFKSVKDAVISGFRLNDEYLGFPLKPQVIERIKSSDGLYHSIDDIIAAHPDKEFRWLLKKDYHIVTDDNLEEICEYIRNYKGYVYYDTETTGLQINFKSRIGQADQLVGVVLSVKYGESFFFPTQMKCIKNLCDGDHWYFMEHYMKPILEGKELVAHNMEFDWKVGYIYGINCNIVHDTMAIIKLTLGAEIKDFKIGLKECAKVLLNRDSLELSDLIIDDAWGKNDIRFWDLPEDSVRLYACADTDNTNGLFSYSEQAGLLDKYNARKVYEIEIAFSYAVAYQEFYGHHLNINNLDSMLEKTLITQKAYLTEMEKIVGHPFNPNSTPQLVKIMYEELGIPTQISRDTNRPTTDSDTLKKLAEITDEEDNIKYPFAGLLSKYRKEEGVRKIIAKFPEVVTTDGYVFSKVSQYGTTTGRVSVSQPNYQSYNDPIKENVIPRPGFYMFDTDYSSVEYRVLGNMVGNKAIMHSFEDPDFDYHQYQAARMYGVPYASVTKKMRKAAKGINFGLPYGMGDESLGLRVFGEVSEDNTRKAGALRNAYFVGQEDIRDWFEVTRDNGVKKGYTETYFGRRRYYRKEEFTTAAIRRQAGNQRIQGCIHGDTRIETEDFGVVRIKDVVGYRGRVWNGEKWTHGDVVYSGKKQKCIITFTNGQKFICSPIHRFLVFDECDFINPDFSADGMFVKCKYLKKGNAIHINTNSDLHIDDYDNRLNKVDCFSYSDDELSEIHEYIKEFECVVVDSVEITDEFIDMYDVCNTDEGYYVADGIVTHNTAADIYKLAVGRVFKRICKEGWLGKVLFSCFIHDELLGEVSNDINPAEFLKVLREEFEVKIENDDGTPWCPLYMGFGYGMSWYEAKSVELPIKLQWEFVNKFGDTGFSEWNGDGRAFCDTIPDKLREFEVRDIRNQILDLDSQGKEIKPALNTQLLDMVKADSKIYAQALSEYMQEDFNEVNNIGVQTYLENCEIPLCEWLDKNYHIQTLYKVDGIVLESFEPVSDTQKALDIFCAIHGVDRDLVNILSIEEKHSSSPMVAGAVGFDDDENQLSSEERLIAMRDSRIDNLGMYLDIENKIIYCQLIDDQSYMSFIKGKSNMDGIGYNIYFRDTNGLNNPNKKGAIYSTKAYIRSEDTGIIQKVYLQYLRNRA